MRKTLKHLQKKIAKFFERAPIKNKEKIDLLYKWNVKKGELHELARMPEMVNGDIWWVGLGENIGVEINGKSKQYSRPVLILKKLSKYSFMGIPLTSKEKSGSWYVKFTFHGKMSVAVLSQARIMSVYRLYNRIGTLDDKDYARVRAGFKRLYT